MPAKFGDDQIQIAVIVKVGCPGISDTSQVVLQGLCLPGMSFVIECQQAHRPPVVILGPETAQVCDEIIVMLILIQVDAFDVSGVFEFCQRLVSRLTCFKSNAACLAGSHVG